MWGVLPPNSRHQGANELDGHSGLACQLSVVEYGRGTPAVPDFARHFRLQTCDKYRVMVACTVARRKGPGESATSDHYTGDEASDDSQVDQEDVEE